MGVSVHMTARTGEGVWLGVRLCVGVHVHMDVYLVRYE